MSWREQAACKGAETSIFFPKRGEKLDRAMEFCNRCPVRPQCLDEAMSVGAESAVGVWGGTSERRRDQLRGWRQRRAS
jgi:WhiB family redox-sensing transcriptional regulator